MPRIRYLKPDFFKDEDLALLPFEARLFFAGLWNFADKAGRLEDRPLRLKVEIFPYDKVDVEKCLKLLNQPKNGSGKPFIQRYEIEGEKYIQIVNWEKHQKPHHTEIDSKLPKPPPLIINNISNINNTLKRMGMEKGMGMEKQLNPSKKLRNGETTVKKTLKSKNSIPPSLNSILKYFQELNSTSLEANKFFDYFQSNGWKVGGKAPMKDWRAAARNWVRRLPPAPQTLKQKGYLLPYQTENIKKVDSLVKGVAEKKGV